MIALKGFLLFLMAAMSLGCSISGAPHAQGEPPSLLAPEKRKAYFDQLSFEQTVLLMDQQLNRCFPGVYSQLRDQGATFADVQPVSKLIHLSVVSRNKARFRFQPQSKSSFIHPTGADYYVRGKVLRHRSGGTQVEMISSPGMSDFGNTVLSWLAGEKACSQKAI